MSTELAKWILYKSAKTFGLVFVLLTSLVFFFTFRSKGLFPGDNYMFKVNNRNTRTRCEICSKLTVKDNRMTPLAF